MGSGAKRPRVVPGGDDGSLQTFQTQIGKTAGHVKLVDHDQQRYDIGTTTIYVGFAAAGVAAATAAWTIKRVTLVDGNPTHVQWSSAVAVWDDRASTIYT